MRRIKTQANAAASHVAAFPVFHTGGYWRYKNILSFSCKLFFKEADKHLVNLATFATLKKVQHTNIIF
jgi:hypothetical protein